MIKRIAVTGPESTGKSLIAEQLALHFDTVWVQEYAREYIGKLHRPYTLDDILEIAKGQYYKEEELIPAANKLIFSDTDFLVTRIWSEHKYKTCPGWISDKAKNHVYDLYLLMDIDLPWQPDPQREHPHMRKYFFDLYYSELKKSGFNFTVISGLGDTRLKNAIDAVEKLI